MNDDLPAILRRFLPQLTTLGLATVDPADHSPYAANVNFVSDDDLNCYWLSSADSAHSLHLAADPRAAATAYAPFDGPTEIRGVQIRGLAARVDPAQFDRIWALFVAKFPHVAIMEELARAEGFYHLTPTWLRLTDNSVHFGFKRETNWPPGDSSVA